MLERSDGGARARLTMVARAMGNYDGAPVPTKHQATKAGAGRRGITPGEIEALRQQLTCKHCDAGPPDFTHTPECPGDDPAVYTWAIARAIESYPHRRRA